jgi:LysM repeat protein
MAAKRMAQIICLVLLALIVEGCRDTPTPTTTPTSIPTKTPTPTETYAPTPTPTTTPTLTEAYTPTITPTPTPVRAADLSVEKAKVQCRHPGEAVEEVDVGQHEPVGTGDEINTYETGRGILTFSDFLRVEVFRKAGLQVKAAPDPDAPPIVKLYLALGTTIQELQEQAGERVEVITETDWATITSVATTYLVSVDEDGVTSVVVYKGEAKVEAQQRVVTLRPGEATLVEPRQAPRSPIDAEMGAVGDWVSGAREAEEVGSIKPVIFPTTATPIPTSTSTVTRTPTRAPTNTPMPTNTPTLTPCIPQPSIGWQQYTIKWGDTLWFLAVSRSTTVQEIRRVNCLSDDAIKAGQELWLPAHTPTPTPALPTATTTPAPPIATPVLPTATPVPPIAYPPPIGPYPSG